MKRKLLIVGSDKIGRRAVYRIRSRQIDLGAFDLAMDCSTGVRRIIKLVASKRMGVTCLANMVISDLRRKGFPQFAYNYRIRNNSDLFSILKGNLYEAAYLFRAGLVISEKNLYTGVKFFNLHCADVKDYGGLCSIFRALKEGALVQHACLHVVTNQIDDPSEVIDRERYILQPHLSYFYNEEMAYRAGEKILSRVVSNAT